MEEEKTKQKPKIRLCIKDINAEGKEELKELLALWENTSKEGKKYYTGKLGQVRVVGFELE